MPTAPTLEAVKDYLSSIEMNSWSDEAVTEALTAEIANQLRVCKFPADPDLPVPPLAYPADLSDALKRRVARNLSLRPLPLGVQVNESVVARLGGLDAEVRRLEAPHRRLVFG